MLERKFCETDHALELDADYGISGYASLFGVRDASGDHVARGAFSASLSLLSSKGRRVKFLWQHDPSEPIGVWDEIGEDDRGLFVKGRILTSLAKGRDAAALLEAGAIDGLSIGYRTRRAHKAEGGNRQLQEIDLWEVSLVTFPMLPTARVSSKDVPSPVAVDPSLEAIEKLGPALRSARNILKGKDSNNDNPLSLRF